MIINIISDEKSWINDAIPGFMDRARKFGDVSWVHSASGLKPADVTFILSYFSLLSPEALALSDHNLVVHESDLPMGRGWSPLTWQVLEGKNRIPVVLFEANERADRGIIYLKREIFLEGHELVTELRAAQAHATFQLCLDFLAGYPSIVSTGREQTGSGSTYARRGPENSKLDPKGSIASQFNLLRVVDNEKYPAFFELHGHRYRIKIEKVSP